MEVKLVLGSTGAVSLSSSGQDFLLVLPSGHPQAAVGDGVKVVCRNLVGGAGQGHGLDPLEEPYREELEVKQGLKWARTFRIVVVPKGTHRG